MVTAKRGMEYFSLGCWAIADQLFGKDTTKNSWRFSFQHTPGIAAQLILFFYPFLHPSRLLAGGSSP